MSSPGCNQLDTMEFSNYSDLNYSVLYHLEKQ